MKAFGFAFLFGVLTSACAGPMTPFGAVNTVVPEHKLAKVQPAGVAPAAEPIKIAARAKTIEPAKLADAVRPEDRKVAPAREPAGLLRKTQTMFLGSGAKPEIRFSPDRQVLHDRTKFTIRINDNMGVPKAPDVTILYNGHDLTGKFMAQAKTELENGGQSLKISFPNLRVLPDRDNKIEVVYRHSKYDPYIFSRYQAPTCDVSEYLPVVKTDGFKLKAAMIRQISKLSEEHKVNPSFFAGLVAQESAFDHRAISWAKAIGLTQITSLAEQEVAKYNSKWPRYEGVAGMPMPMLKSLIMSGEINSKNEWRLNPHLSLRGGLTYLNLLSNYWRRPDNYAKIAAQFKNPEEGFAQVLLASYNSGFVRVGQALERSGTNWIKENDLREARKYVGRVLSYCYHFSHEEDDGA
ncbi:MAG: transglycosylase SLT domain-containing protein [Bdellovibrionia bacterium]